MKIDFWNNPLVVSAFRVKYRRGSPGLTCAAYLLVLLGIGAMLHYNAPSLSIPFGRAYLLAIFVVQAGLSAGIGLLTVGASMNAELANRTLDFQRIVALSPRQILLGKMIGEPLIAYCLLLTTVPLAVICWSLGGGSALAIGLIYLNLLSLTLLSAAAGTLNPLTEPADKTGKQQQSGHGWGLFVGLFWGVPWIMRSGTTGLDHPWLGSIVGLLTPLGVLMHLYEGNPFNARAPLFALDVPVLIAAPLVQLAAAAWLMHWMARRLKNGIDPPVSKRGSYATLAVLDLWYASICYHAWVEGGSLASLVYQFLLAHVLTCLVLVLMTTPQRPALMAWIWRTQGRTPRFRDRLLGQRSPTTLVGPIFAGIGTAILLGALWLPIAVRGPAAPFLADSSILWEAIGYGALLVVALCFFHQWQTAAAGRVGTIAFLVATGVLVGIPLLVGALLSETTHRDEWSGLIDALIGVSPISLFAARIGEVDRFADRDHLQPLWLAGAYGLLALLAWQRLSRWITRRSKVVGEKLRKLHAEESPR